MPIRGVHLGLGASIAENAEAPMALLRQHLGQMPEVLVKNSVFRRPACDTTLCVLRMYR